MPVLLLEVHRVRELLGYLRDAGAISADDFARAQAFLNASRPTT